MNTFTSSILHSRSSGTQIAAAVVFAAALATHSFAAEAQLSRYEATEKQMGMPVRVVVYAKDSAQARQAFRTAFAKFSELNAIFSDYRNDSELMRLSLASPTPAEQGIPVSGELFQVLAAGQKLAERSHGAFDLTVGPLTQLWRKSRRARKLPEPEILRAAQAAVGFQHLKLHPANRTVELMQPRMRLDAGGIAVGFAIDEALRCISKLGIASALIDASGDIGVTAAPPGETGWRIGVAPLDPSAAPSRFLRLKNCAVTTSGDAFQHITLKGVRYSHILDPRTGLGLTRLMAVTVISPDCMTADSLATAACVLGPRQTEKLLPEYPGSEALFLLGPETNPQAGADETTTNPQWELETVESSGFKKWVESPTTAAE
jgi:thiamine biosynthesis lipoprotein